MKELEVYKDFSLKGYNTFGIDALADRFIALRSTDEYADLLSSGVLDDGRFFILGGGSNVVFSDKYQGTVVHPANKGVSLIGQEGSRCFVEAGAGEVWADFVDSCISQGWYGLENLAAIPGCVGASPVQNVGAYGKEAKDVIWRVHCFDITNGAEHWIDAADCGFDYRWSNFKGEWKNRFIIDRVVFRLDSAFTPNLSYKALSEALAARNISQPTARQLADTVAAVRDSKLPNPQDIGSAGSFFKNPIVGKTQFDELKAKYPDIVAFPLPTGDFKLAAGWMIERCGWKGRSMGRVGVYEKQALVLVNHNGCSGQEVRRLANAIIADVETHFGIRLDCEAIFVDGQ